MEAADVTRTFAHAPEQGEARWWLGGLALIKASGPQTGGHYTLVEVHEPHGSEAPLHVHHRDDEAFWVLEGSYTFYVGDQTISAGPGSFLFGPKGVPHRYRVDEGPGRLLFLLSPAGFEDFIRVTSEPAPSATLPPPGAPPTEAELEQLAALASQHNMDLLG